MAYCRNRVEPTESPNESTHTDVNPFIRIRQKCISLLKAGIDILFTSVKLHAMGDGTKLVQQKVNTCLGVGGGGQLKKIKEKNLRKKLILRGEVALGK